MITIKTEQDIEKLRTSGKRLGELLAMLAPLAVPGVSAKELDDIAYKFVVERGDKPAFLNYKPEGARTAYPASLCVSINDEIVHGIPLKESILKEGDVVKLDMGLTHQGMITDSAVTVIVGKGTPETEKLVAVTKAALDRGIAMARPGNRVGDISSAIGNYVKGNGLSVMEGLAGHGVGYKVHEDPYVPNEGEKGTGELLRPGMVIAIEPMASLGGPEIALCDDGHTYVTDDGSVSAQFEHTVLITEGDPEILTKRP